MNCTDLPFSLSSHVKGNFKTWKLRLPKKIHNTFLSFLSNTSHNILITTYVYCMYVQKSKPIWSDKLRSISRVLYNAMAEGRIRLSVALKETLTSLLIESDPDAFCSLLMTTCNWPFVNQKSLNVRKLYILHFLSSSSLTFVPRWNRSLIHFHQTF